jgi:c-di-GMP-binding flagellar brake protein YcgR
MENQRKTFRHRFEQEETLRVELQFPGKKVVVRGDVLDLSLGGMRLRVDEPPAELQAGKSVTARLIGREAVHPVSLDLVVPARIVYLRLLEDTTLCGLHFLPTASANANEAIERSLSRFLLSEQRRKRSV